MGRDFPNEHPARFLFVYDGGEKAVSGEEPHVSLNAQYITLLGEQRAIALRFVFGSIKQARQSKAQKVPLFAPT
jgi:hypothetical protein